MKTKKIIIIGLFLCFGIIYATKSSGILENFFNSKAALTPPSNSEILGVWTLENSPSDKIEFLNNGTVKWYVDSNVSETCTYEITNVCNGNTSSNVEYLKFTNDIDNTYCNVIMSINENGNNTVSFVDQKGHLNVYLR
jgi:carboxypeptidase C (cathepsin A)